MKPDPQVVGIDGTRSGWVAVVLQGGAVAGIKNLTTIAECSERFPHAGLIAVDMPIGYPVDGPRLADVEARRWVGPRASSIFPACHPDLLNCADHAAACALAKQRGLRGVTS